jgi:hypothetical protein
MHVPIIKPGLSFTESDPVDRRQIGDRRCRLGTGRAHLFVGPNFHRLIQPGLQLLNYGAYVLFAATLAVRGLSVEWGCSSRRDFVLHANGDADQILRLAFLPFARRVPTQPDSTVHRGARVGASRFLDG